MRSPMKQRGIRDIEATNARITLHSIQATRWFGRLRFANRPYGPVLSDPSGKRQDTWVFHQMIVFKASQKPKWESILKQKKPLVQIQTN
jgi:hypothetical protein